MNIFRSGLLNRLSHLKHKPEQISYLQDSCKYFHFSQLRLHVSFLSHLTIWTSQWREVWCAARCTLNGRMDAWKGIFFPLQLRIQAENISLQPLREVLESCCSFFSHDTCPVLNICHRILCAGQLKVFQGTCSVACYPWYRPCLEPFCFSFLKNIGYHLS